MNFGFLGWLFSALGAEPYTAPAGGGGGSPSLDFSEATNSMYIGFI